MNRGLVTEAEAAESVSHCAPNRTQTDGRVACVASSGAADAEGRAGHHHGAPRLGPLADTQPHGGG
jgi:hypothetical protein